MTISKMLTKGTAVTATNCALRDADSGDYESGSKRFSFAKAIYGAKSVKLALAKAQFEKCCFCEGEFSAHVAGDVEHFRPKGSVRLPTGRIYPGYYWLAYEPDNLYFACPDCNEYRKGDRFPLSDEARRARSHHQLVSAEHNLILDPGGPVDPRDHIRFAADFPVGLTETGRETIKALKLDREPLNKRRRTVLNRLRGEQEVILLGKGDPRPAAVARVAAASKALRNAVQPDAEFSAAAQDFLAGWTPP